MHIHSYVGLSGQLVHLPGVIMPPVLLLRFRHSQPRVQTYLFYIQLLSRKLLNSEVCGNASGYGGSYSTVLWLSVILICTNTEGPSQDRAPSFYILIIPLYTDVYGEKHHTYSNVCHISTYIIN